MNEFNMVSADELNRIEGGSFGSFLNSLENDVKKAVNWIENNGRTIASAAPGAISVLEGVISLF